MSFANNAAMDAIKASTGDMDGHFPPLCSPVKLEGVRSCGASYCKIWKYWNACPVVPSGAGSDPTVTPHPGMWKGLKNAYPASDYALEDGLRVPTDIPPGRLCLELQVGLD